MPRTKKFTLIIIIGILLAVFAVPYLYHQLVHSPAHDEPAGVSE